MVQPMLGKGPESFNTIDVIYALGTLLSFNTTKWKAVMVPEDLMPI
jgi:hypothetical protein